ncbi:hypothetical protein [Burkholderia ubonensis]|uniref:hypothetical protein n=1 Tax=Burkholderia ubonensis TaxID=101571 RepID=UPI0012F9C830|nr:hypothetical protein [Burkholderia ubonensis]
MPKRNAKALKPPRLPILTFDEWKLRLALDGVFNVTWLMPGESLLSILWKFACANALPGDILRHLVCPTADPSEGVVPVRGAINLKGLCRLICWPRDVLLVSLLDAQRHGRYHTNFRYCRQCAAHGYHSVLHQLGEEDRCPAHQQSLGTQCPHCRRETPYIVSASVIEAPFRCIWCHSHYSYGRLSLLSTAPAMRRRDRLAISRRFHLHLSNGIEAAGPQTADQCLR